MSAPYEPGQRVTATIPCLCGADELILLTELVTDVDGVFECEHGHKGLVRDYADVTPVGAR